MVADKFEFTLVARGVVEVNSLGWRLNMRSRLSLRETEGFRWG
jgi:hypothetical protein